MNRKQNIIIKSKLKYLSVLVIMGLLIASGCKKLYNLPEEKDFLSGNLNYQSKILEPVLGRTSLMGNVSLDNSTLPMTFEIVNPRYGDGRPVTDLFQVRPTWVWKAAYDGLETSLEEIEGKRELEDRPLFEVRESGQFIMWASSTNELIEPRPKDSSDLVQDIRFFDLKVSNSGGEMLIKDFQIRPWREQPYSPFTDINPYTGELAPDPSDPNNPRKRDFIRPSLSNVIGVESNQMLHSNDEKKDVVVYIRPFEGGSGKNLRFVFLDKDSVAMNPALFNETKWETLVHGFNMIMTQEFVQYDVAYPIPLVDIRTEYASGGNANVNFSYSRKGYGGNLTFGSIGLDFKIFRPGDWEIVFHFRSENPKFDDE